MTVTRAVVVDDNRLNREIVVRTLEAQGIQVAQAEEAASGWKLIQATSPHLLVLDIMLPGAMDGVALCRLVRSDAHFANTVIIMVTAAEKRREADRSLAAGADILLPKPFSPKELWFHVDSLLKRKKPSVSPKKIFVLDDDEKDCQLVEVALSKAGFQVQTQTTTTGAIAAIKNFRPDLILMDVMMAGISGDEMVGIIHRDKSYQAKPKIIYFSNRSTQDLQSLVQKSGVEGFVSKTDGPSSLLKTINQVLAQ